MAHDAIGNPCRDCGRGPLVPASNRPGVVHGGRGLCRRCYESRRRVGTLDQHPRSNAPAMARGDVVRQYVALRSGNLTMTEIARRIGISRDAMYGALRRDRNRPARLSPAEVERLRRMVGVA